MEISIQVGIKVKETEKYDMSLYIPTTDLTPQAPFRFAVAQQSDDGHGKIKVDNVLQVAFSDAEHVCVLVKPPQSLLETAKISEYVDNLQVVVQEGTYDSSSGTFVAGSTEE